MGRKELKILAIDEVARSNFIGAVYVCGVFVVGHKEVPNKFFDSKKCKNSHLDEVYQEYIQYIDDYKVIPISEDLLEDNNIIDLELKVIKELIAHYNPDIVYLDFLGRKRNSVTKSLGLNGSVKLVYQPKLDEKNFYVACASIIAKKHREDWYKSMNYGFSDYNYKVLDKFGYEKSLQIPHVRKRWIKTYFHKKRRSKQW